MMMPSIYNWNPCLNQMEIVPPYLAIAPVTVHIRRYLGTIKRKLSSDEPPQRVSRSQVAEFIFKCDCLFCGDICVPKNPKNPRRWVPVSQCETETRPGQPIQPSSR